MKKKWTGNQERQEEIANEIISHYAEEDPIDLVGALESLILHILFAYDPDAKEATILEGLKAIHGDMVSAVLNHYHGEKRQ